MSDLTLPFPSPLLVPHAKGHWRPKADATKQHRHWAKLAALVAGWKLPKGSADIHIIATFYPPSRRFDRVNMPGMLKAYWDGISDATGANDRRFHPRFQFAEPSSEPCVIFSLLEDVHD